MEKFPTQEPAAPVEEPTLVERKSVKYPGGYERGWIYKEFSLSKLDEHSDYTCELETQSGNKYVIKPVTEVTPEAPTARYSITNEKTGKTTYLNETDLGRVARLGKSFEWSGGNTTAIKSILFYPKGKTYSDKLGK